MNAKYRLAFLILSGIIIWKTFQYLAIFSKPRERKDTDNLLVSKETIKVTVYYEALCSDSRNFIIKQLSNTYEDLCDHIVLDLIPYGKAQTIETDGKITFQCQHAATECLANTIHACVIDLIVDQDTQLKYISCMIADNMVPHEALERCGQELGLDHNPVLECSNGHNGTLLLKAYGIKTHAVRPQISFIPTIEFDNSQKIPLSRVLKNFRKELCSLYTIKPNACL